MKRLIVLIAVLVVGLTLVAGTAGAASGRPGTVTPQVGHYEGRDSRGGHIRFYLNHLGHVTNFRIEHQSLGNGALDGTQFHACSDSVCAHGSWATTHEVTGFWNNHHAGHGALFSAHHRQPSGSQTSLF